MESVGIELKATREKRNIALEDVAAATRISHTNLERLEEGRYRDLPGGVYNRAFIRAYCEYLGLEPKDMLARYEQEITPPSEKVTRSKERTKIPSEPFVRPHPLAAWGFMLIASIVGLYFSRHWIAGVFSPYFAHSPASNIAANPPVSKPQAKPAPPAGSPGLIVPQQLPPASGGLAAAKPESSITTTPPSAAAPQSIDAKQAAAVSDGKTASPLSPIQPGKIQLEIQVTETCWISVNSDGNRATVKLMEPGEHHVFGADERFFLIVGNAGGIRLSINGKQAKSLGKSGEVSRVLINAQTMKSLLQNPSD